MAESFNSLGECFDNGWQRLYQADDTACGYGACADVTDIRTPDIRWS